MNGAPQARRGGNTRQRIQDVALGFFLERGYEKTSLREVADELGISKPAVYYHFKTKEDILVGLLGDVGRELDALIAWGREQPRTLESKRELLARYSVIFDNAAPLFRIMQQNIATLSELTVGQEFTDRTTALAALLKDADAPMAAQVRCVSALLTLHFGTFALEYIDGAAEDKRLALLDSATELLTSAYAVQETADGPAA
ncbi:TetR/AcrR family transcriptional regulator [Streptomyces cinnamoneus]|nr:TetR/AcrR family transcriptional regulator [Streptomyces cinnamoneus]